MRPARPFGLTLAILASWLLFTIIPLIGVMVAFYINSYVYRGAEGEIVGTNITGFQPAPYALVMVIALTFAFIGFFTWRGRPSLMRWLFPVCVGLLTAVVVFGIVIPQATATPDLQQGIDSSQAAGRGILSAYAIATLIAALYALWFCNRWSARAFFRGFYTEKDKRSLEAIGLSVDT